MRYSLSWYAVDPGYTGDTVCSWRRMLTLIRRKRLEGRRRRFGLLLPIDSAQNSAGSRRGIPRDAVAPPTRQP
jgi:hypothetical protein